MSGIRKYSTTVLRNVVTQVKSEYEGHQNFHKTIDIPFPFESKVIQMHPIWLRHHCNCEKCFNAQTFQKMVIPSHLPKLCGIKDLASSSKTNCVQITWMDEHKSTFNLNWLEKSQLQLVRKQDEAQERVRLPETSFKGLCPFPESPLENGVDYEEFMRDDHGVGQILENIVKFGYGIVTNAPTNFEETKNVVRRISHPQNTIYGDFSEWSSNLQHLHADTAYTSDFIHMHTDTTYFSEPMGLQMFHCLKHEGSGGINSLVDGFQVAKMLAEKYPLEFSMLTQSLVPCQYLDPGKHHFYNVDLTLKHSPLTHSIERIRYNPHDLAKIDTVPFHQIPAFYQSLTRLSDELESCPTWLKLSPGLIIFLDNWRVLHGRSEFTGFRHLCGAYISRSDWLSKARVLGVIS